MLFDDMIMWMVKQKLKDTYLFKGNVDLSVALVRPRMGLGISFFLLQGRCK